uniref:Down syndrome cell adhesion molecule-like protein Dscam2 n=1 Tax=Strigamia maritima TaxID=126957 RepID=T1IT69_STRMM
MTEPPFNIEFSNNTGSTIACSASGQPSPTVHWILPDGNRVTTIPGLRHLENGGELIFRPFQAENYRQDVHTMSYRCVASNSAGTIVSRDVNIRAVMTQPYEAHVYDAYPLKGNTAILKCHLPPFIGSHVIVSAWIKNNAVKIDSTTNDNKYSIFSDELFVSNVDENDAASSFRCETTNTLTKETKLSSTAGKLFVSDPKSPVAPRIIDSIVSVSANAISDVILPCIVQGFPVPELEWFVKTNNEQSVPVVFGDRIFKSENSIKIKQIQTNGIYVCEAKNSIGKDKKEINVTVRVPLSVRIEPNQLKLDVNKVVNLKCIIEGNPVKSIDWFRNGQSFHFNNLSNSIRIEESGMYQCFAKNENSMVHDTAQVIAGDKLPEIISSFEEKIMEPGNNLKLECEAIANPRPSAKWFIDGNEIDQTNRISIKNNNKNINLARSVLEIPNIKSEDGGVYTCQFVNVKGVTKHSNRINVVGTPGIRPMKKVQGIAGRSVQINCPYYGYPIKQIKWMKDFQSLPTDPRQFLHDNGSLWITEMLRGVDDGVYTCVVKNENTEATQDVEIVVMISPKIMPFHFQEDLLREGMRARLQCVVSEGDTPLKIQWLKDNINLPSNLAITVRNLDEFSSILTISNINPKHNGNYTCQASNSAATSTHTAKLNVNASPKIIPFAFLDDQFYKGMRAQVTCSVSQGDLPLRFQWSKYNEQLPSSALGVVIRQYDPFTSSLSIENVAAEHSGNYTCFVSNRAANVSHTAQLSVHVAPKIIPFSFQHSMAEGTQARVLCGLGEGDAPVIFSWLKNGLPISQKDIVIIRTPDNFSSILSVPKVHQSHSGNYTCVATNHAATAEFTTAPKIIPFSFQEDNLIEGVFARVSCVVYQGDLPISISWLKDETPIHNVNGITIRNIDEFSSILTIDSIQQRHSGNYTCVAENSAATISSTASLIVHVPPKIVPFTFQDEHLLEGMLVRVSCVVSRGDLPLSITWLKDGQSISKSKSITLHDFDDYSSILSIDPVTAKHNGNYTCIATNAAASVTYSSPLSVNVPPKWIQSPNDTSVVIGADLQLPCATEGFPKPIVTWTKSEGRTKERRVLINTENQIITENGTLHIFVVKKEDKGFYFCEAKNGIGRLGGTVKVTIRTPPQVLMKVQNITSHKGEDINLQCETTGDTPIQFIWKLDKKILTDSPNKYALQNFTENKVSTSKLTILNTNHKDSNAYQCIATNEYGEDEAVFHLYVKDVPIAPTNLKVLESVNRTMTITWSLQEGAVSQYIIQYKHINENWKESKRRPVPGKINTAKISHLLPSQKYEVRVLAENEVGLSDPSNTIEAVIAEEAPGAAPSDISVIAIDTNTLKVSWKSPSRAYWNGIIRGYYIGHKVSDSGEPYIFRLIEVPEDYTDTLSLTVTDLLKYSQYSVVIQAFNDGGKGPLSKEIIAVTSESVPTKAPADIRCSVLTSQSVHITWQSPPSLAIHGVLQGYKVLFKPINQLPTRNANSGIKTTTINKMTLNKLLKYANYSFQVLAFTKKGDGIKSDPIYCRTLEDIPGPVAAIKVLPASQKSVLVAWKYPENPNGAISKYTIYFKNDDDNEVVNQHTVNGNTTFHEITSLNHDANYEFWVTAATTMGEGPRIAAFNSAIVTTEDKDIKLACPAIGIPEPKKNGLFSNRLVMLSDGALLIKDSRRHESDNYTCHVENERGDDLVTYSVLVQSVPNPLVIDISLTTTSSIDILWKIKRDSGAPITGFKLVYKTDQQPWKTLELDSNIESYRLDNLNCGTKYQLYMIAVNEIGEGKASLILTASTKGGVPLSPSKQNLIDEGSTFVNLNLNSWQIDNCPIKYFVLEYKSKVENQWQLYSDDVENDKRKILLSDLKPATWYNLRMIAHSNAGTAVAEYLFATLTSDGGILYLFYPRFTYHIIIFTGTISPNTVPDNIPNSPIALLLDLKFIVIFSTVIIALLIIIFTLLCYCSKTNKKSRKHNKSSQHKRSTLQSDGTLTYNGSIMSDGRSGTINSDELTPYATARLTDFVDGKPMMYPRPGSKMTSNEMISFRNQMPTAPPMSDSYNSNSLPFYSQIHKKGNQGPLTPNRSILKSVAMSIPSVPLNQQPPEFSSQRMLQTDNERNGLLPPPPPPPMPESKNKVAKNYDAPWDLKRTAN